jgi:hypothetical protein
LFNSTGVVDIIPEHSVGSSAVLGDEVQCRDHTPAYGDGDGDSSSLSDISESSESKSTISTEEQQIPKPPGEVGRPGRGGYNLDDTLNWDSESLRKLKVSYPHYNFKGPL